MLQQVFSFGDDEEIISLKNKENSKFSKQINFKNKILEWKHEFSLCGGAGI